MPFAGNLHLPAAHFCLWGKVYATQQKLHNQKFTQKNCNCLPPSGQAQTFSTEFSFVKIPNCHSGLKINKKIDIMPLFPSKRHLTEEILPSQQGLGRTLALALHTSLVPHYSLGGQHFWKVPLDVLSASLCNAPAVHKHENKTEAGGHHWF